MDKQRDFLAESLAAALRDHNPPPLASAAVAHDRGECWAYCVPGIVAALGEVEADPLERATDLSRLLHRLKIGCLPEQCGPGVHLTEAMELDEAGVRIAR